MGSLFFIKSAALDPPCTIDQVSEWLAAAQVSQNRQAHGYDYHQSKSMIFDIKPMSDGRSGGSVAVDHDHCRQPRDPTPHNLFSMPPSHATTPVTTLPPEDGSGIVISVFSQASKSYVDLSATVVPDEKCTENWISRDLINTLGLKSFKRFEDSTFKIGQLENGFTFKFDGTVSLGWTWKIPHPHDGLTVSANFLVVPENVQQSTIWLKASLCEVPGNNLNTLTTMIAPTPQIEIPNHQTPIILQLENVTSTRGGSAYLASDSGSESEKQGIIDDDGNLYGDDSHEAVWADEWIDHFTANIKRIFKGQRQEPAPKVKIAILDTGVDHNHSYISGVESGDTPVIVQCRTFVGAFESCNDQSRTQDTDGHGTHIVGLVLKLAPHAEIYIAKISETRQVPVDSRIDEAIHWAMDNNVDIISMSFGFTSWKTRIGDAIKKASSGSKNILLFAAASNKGRHFEPSYPASDGNVICIYATDGYGNRSDVNPQTSKNKNRFATLGRAIKLLDAGTKAGVVRGSGTSYATPIAAAIAANIIELAIRTKMDHVFLERLKNRQGMEKVFSLMVPKDDTNELDCLNLKTLFHKHMRDTSIHDVIMKTLDP